MSSKNEKSKIKSLSKFVAVLGILLLFVSVSAIESFAQNQTPIGEINGKQIYADDVINQINNDSPFMPALEDDKITQDPTAMPAPNATPVPTPAPRPAAASFNILPSRQRGRATRSLPCSNWKLGCVLPTHHKC